MLRTQLLAFLFGIFSAVPALSMADELDEVINDLVKYRSAKRGERVADPFLEVADKTGKNPQRQKAQTKKPVPASVSKAVKIAKK